MKTERFTIAIPEDDLQDMRRRIRTTRWADDFANESWSYGVERGWLKDMAHYWAEEFDWRAQEAEINRWPHYRATVDGVPIHFLHVPGKGPAPKPLILTHGWPWTFWDWKDVIGPLTDPAAHGGDPADAFELVIPSLPGFTFSNPLRTPLVGVRRVAELWVSLMRDTLGHERFYAAGGDWGALVTSELGHAHARHVEAIYLTLPFVPGLSPLDIPREAFAEDEQWMADRQAEANPLIASHVSVHVHDPQTLAYALADSPIGTAAWIWERRRAWSDCDGDVAALFGEDFLCTTASLLWLTNSIGSSLRIYAEHFRYNWPVLHDRKPVIEVPTGLAVSPKEVVMVPRSYMEDLTNLRRYTIFPRGGHFAPSEFPEQVIGEYRAFFGAL